MESVDKLTKDIKEAAKTLSQSEARYYVDTYYKVQDARIRSKNQERAAGQSEEVEPNALDTYLGDQFTTLEKEIAKALKKYCEAQPIGEWLMSITGIGAVIAAGLISRIDIEKAENISSLWRYAGYSPGQKRRKGELADWNPNLKRICWLSGQSFVKVSGNEKAKYGKLYQSRKAQEQAHNDNGMFKAQAEAALTNKKYGKDTEAYKAYSEGKLPPAHIQARAERYAVKMLLSDLWLKWREIEGLPVSDCWVKVHGGH